MTTSVPNDRTVAALREVWTSLGDLLRDLSDDEWARESPLPGWSVQDNVSHIIGTEAMLLGQRQPEGADPATVDHVKNDIGTFNEAWVASLRSCSPQEMLDRFQQTTSARLAALDELSDSDWNADSFTPAGKDTYGRFMQIRAFDCWLHEQDIRDAVGRPGHVTGVAVDVTLDELANAMGFVVGKKAGAEAGDRVKFVLTNDGEVVREINVEVGDRAGVVEQLTGPATVTLTMPVGVMTRRCAGRVGVDDLLDQVAIDGDLDLASRILRNQSYTI